LHEPPQKVQRTRTQSEYDDDDQDDALVSWQEELENHDDDEGDYLEEGTQVNCADQRDIIAEMSHLTEHPLLLTEVAEEQWCGLSDAIICRLLNNPKPQEVEIVTG
jgi:hypothetical protein